MTCTVGIPLTPAHVDRWLRLWRAAVEARYAGPVADHAKLQGARASPRVRRVDSLWAHSERI